MKKGEGVFRHDSSKGPGVQLDAFSSTEVCTAV